MNKKLILLAVTFILTCTFGFGQIKKRCIVEEIEHKKNQLNPNRISKKNDFERAVAEKILELNNKNARIAQEVIRIPVVVHVIHDNAEGRIGGLTNKNIFDDK
ncbi:MAG: hypothetical protein MUF45_06025 [Spirosomaceae bacterium]|nr:hypothetical protein [Spirosomataceae bacterium]